MASAMQSAAATAVLRPALERFASRTGFPIVFGGLMDDGAVTVVELRGNRGDALRGLRVHPGRGLGGRALLERRPRITRDYRTARTITHDYDGAVLAEGISTLLAVPVVDGGRVRGLLWGGVHADVGIGGVRVERAAEAAGWLADRLRSASPATPSALVEADRLPASSVEELRRSWAEVRSVRERVADAALRDRLAAVEERLARLAGGDAAEPAADHALSPRELDVLGQVALGLRNRQIGERLGLKESTVKGSLVTAMGKLGAASRYEAVSLARRGGALP